ncbi:hypothetical protein COZ60_02350 [Candidatus Bathyarchaeota archaeon CG_4_8_14_3_um_filter_42_8]|nr:MAG: hypothetical protein COZ60_02350 [Candidatus Bathyarchaeota archaeon CG_4_8_14_3_um_filter_42_8]
MWFVIVFIVAVIVTAMHFGLKNLKKYKLDFLALMLWGTFLMILVDHTITFLHEGGNFIEITTDGLVPNAAILGILMVVPLLAIWVIAISTKFDNRICVD